VKFLPERERETQVLPDGHKEEGEGGQFFLSQSRGLASSSSSSSSSALVDVSRPERQTETPLTHKLLSEKGPLFLAFPFSG